MAYLRKLDPTHQRFYDLVLPMIATLSNKSITNTEVMLCAMAITRLAVENEQVILNELKATLAKT